MYCLINTGYSKSCGFSLGGLRALYLANHSEVVGIIDSNTDNVLDQINMSTSGSHKFYKFEFSKNTAFFTNDFTESNGNKYVNQSVGFTLDSTSQETSDLMEKLALGKFIAITEDRKGQRKIIGFKNGLEKSSGSMNSGTAEGDLNGSVIVLTGAEAGYAPEFSATGSIPQ